MTREEEQRLIANTAAKIDVILKNVNRMSEVLDDLAAVLERECVSYTLEALEITEKKLDLKLSSNEIKPEGEIVSFNLENCTTLGDLVDLINGAPDFICFLRKRHSSILLEKLPKMLRALPKIHNIRLVIRL